MPHEPTPIEQVAAALHGGIHQHVVVVAGAEPLHPLAIAAASQASTVIAADGGLDHALTAGLRPAALVGDLDSVSAEGLEWATEHAAVVRHDPDKDHTDTELALATAADLMPERLTLVAGGGDRLDHTLAALGALGHPSLTAVPVLEAWWGSQYLRVVHGPGRARLTGLADGSTVSLLSAHGTCEGVGASGVRWPLEEFELGPLLGLGVSNETVGDPEFVVTSGVLTIVVPEYAG